MKKSILAAAFVSAAFAAVLALALLERPREERLELVVEPVPGPETLRASAVAEAPAPPAREAEGSGKDKDAAAHAAAPRIEDVVSEEDGRRVEVVRVPRRSTLARVNGVALTLAELVPGGARGGGDEIMSPELYRFLLDEAIQRELVLQASSRLGIDLTEEEKRRLESIREAMVKAGEEEPGVTRLDEGGSPEDRIEFEMRDVTRRLLLASMLERSGSPPPHVTEDLVKEYVQSHPEEYPDAGARGSGDPAWREIDVEVRRKLAPIVRERYEESARKLVDGLRAEANIIVVPPQDRG